MMSSQNPPRSTLLREAALAMKGKIRILNSGDLLTILDFIELAQLDPTRAALQLEEWKLTGKIFAITHEGVEYFPIYGFDPAAGYSPRPSMHEVITILGLKKNGWGMAFWFGSPNSYLAGRMPKDVFMENLGSVLEAAKDEVTPLPF